MTSWTERCRSVPAGLALASIKLYRYGISPWLGARCRHAPSCSEYAEEAIRLYGAARGGWLALKRLGRCQPWGTDGYDPVPQPRSEP